MNEVAEDGVWEGKDDLISGEVRVAIWAHCDIPSIGSTDHG